MKTWAGVVCLLIGMAAVEYEPEYREFIRSQNTPAWILEVFSEQQLDERYGFSTQINPFYLRGDFDGDAEPDVAILVHEKVSGKQGIAIVHHATKKVHVVGAASKLGNGGDDFSWMDVWCVYRKGPVYRGIDEDAPPELSAEAIYVAKSESSSAIIYWDGQEYRWYQQGD